MRADRQREHAGTSVALLAENFQKALGQDKALALVREACRQLGYAEETLDHDQGKRVLETLSQREGLVGIVAGFALAKVHFGRTLARQQRA